LALWLNSCYLYDWAHFDGTATHKVPRVQGQPTVSLHATKDPAKTSVQAATSETSQLAQSEAVRVRLSFLTPRAPRMAAYVNFAIWQPSCNNAAERQAVAMMDHPGIAKVFDAGATESGRPYFAMELVKGREDSNL